MGTEIKKEQMDQYLEDAVKAAKATGDLLRDLVAKIDYDQISDEDRDAFVDEVDYRQADFIQYFPAVLLTEYRILYSPAILQAKFAY